MGLELKQESLRIPFQENDFLYLKRFWCVEKAPAVFCLHGSIENGRIFYSHSGKGLAPYLAHSGYDVYVADLRGRGRSTPPISADSRYGQTEAIVEELPAFLDFITSCRGRAPEYWVAHSWGGVLLMSLYARFPDYRQGVRKMVFFGTKRCIRACNWEKFLKVNLFWNLLAPFLSRCVGYVPVKTLGLGAENESAKFQEQVKRWALPSPWVDPEDGFDYAAAIRETPVPPILNLSGVLDRCLGHPNDVRDFILECGASPENWHILGREHGQLHDYGHIDILTHPDCTQDHFPMLKEFLR